MSSDLIVGFLAGIAGSVLTIFGTLITNRQKHKQDLKKNLQEIVLNQSFKEYELRSNMIREFDLQGRTVVYYPYDMFLVTYSKIAEYLSKGKKTDDELVKLLDEMNKIRKAYEENQKVR